MTLCIELLEPEQYLRPIKPILSGSDSYVHVAKIKHGGESRRWYVKLALDRCSPPCGLPYRALLNEIVGYTLAHYAKVPQPKAGMIRIHREPLERMHPGVPLPLNDYVCFVTLEAHNPRRRSQGMIRAVYADDEVLTNALRNWEPLALLMAFDTWLANIDRNTGNIIQCGRNIFQIIDHGRLLSGLHWAVSDLDSDKYYLNRLLDELFDAKNFTLPMKNAIVKSAEEFSQVYGEAKHELKQWLDTPDPDKQAANAFIYTRTSSVPTLLKQRLDVY